MIRKLIEYFIIKNSGLFDAHYYLYQYKDVRRADVDPLIHYVSYGWKEGRNPSHSFDTNYYLEMNQDVEQFGVNPLVHYIRYGKNEGRHPAPATNNVKDLFTPNENYHPKVTVIVPNYNHASYLIERLDSIYQQTYKNFEVILLDDCSKDESPSIIKNYATKYPQNTRFFINETNSGSPFAQWKKGILLAEGELIWIAESDDFCDRNFLETLVPYFSDEAILLSYAHTVFVDRLGKPHPFAFENYVSTIHPNKWNSSYIETAHNEVETGLGLLNTIPNVSGVVFRKVEGKFPLLEDSDWLTMKVCGDWLFYLHLINGGKIAYCHETQSYFRIHQASTSKKTQTQEIYYQEHEKVGCAIASLYRVSDELLGRLHNRLMDYYFDNVTNGTKEKFLACFDLEKVLESRKLRKPNALVATYAFAYGGGEIFAVRLANALKENGVNVTFFNGGYEPTQYGVRKMLLPQIPVINNKPGLNIPSILKEFGIEIIHTHHASMENLFAVLRGKDSKSVKHVATMHGMYEMMAHRFIFNTRNILGSVDHWIYTAEKNLTPFNKYNLYQLGKFTKIDNGMKVPEFRRIDLSSLGISSNSIITCLASRALPEKGWLEAIEAVGMARENLHQDVHLILIGEGPMYLHLKSQNLPEYVHLLGYKANLDDYLASSQIGLIPSYFKGESFPLVMIECFMVEIPVIATRIGEIERMITTDNHEVGGILINLDKGKVDSVELANAIERLVVDRYFYDHCVKVVGQLKKRFDMDLVAQKYITVYQRVLE